MREHQRIQAQGNYHGTKTIVLSSSLGDFEVFAFAVLVLIEAALTAVVLQIINSKRGSSFKLAEFDIGVARKILKESAPEILAGLGVVLFMKMDQVMLQYMVGPSSVGTFAVAARLAEIWYFVPIAIVGSIFPSLIAQRAVDRKSVV